MVAEKSLPRGAADFVLTGALMGPIESTVQAANIPFISPALSAYPGVISLQGGRPLNGVGHYAPANISGGDFEY
jgi:hypothetical protein